jgi:Zn-dependent protease
MGSLFNMNSILFNKIILLPGIIIGLTLHEFAHAFVADKLGDKTPRFQGRLTLNPSAHLDPLGFIMIIIFGFGWAKPVQVNPSAYKNYRKDDLKVSLAGPITNFLIAIVMTIIVGVYYRFGYRVLPGALSNVLFQMMIAAITINVGLGLFNLLPVPQLDGFSILKNLSPKTFYKYENSFYKYQMIIMLFLLYFGGRIISIPQGIIVNCLIKLMYLVVNIF